MTRKSIVRGSAAATALLIAGGTADLGWAQDDQDSEDVEPMERITVTARKTEETAFEVPISLTAITEQTIQDSGLDNISDVALQTPGFSFRQGFGRTGGGQGGASVRPSIRGQSNILGGPNAAFFVDGIFVSGNITSYQLDNVQQIEVLRGPQSALFGRQTFSGAINFITRKPDNEFRGRLNLTAAQYNHYEASGYVSGPIVEDKLFGEINARYYNFGGDYINQDNGKRDINDQMSWNIGGKLRFTPNENLEIIANAAYSEDQDKGYATALLGSENLNCFEPVTDVLPPFFGIPRSTTRSRGYFCGEVESPPEDQLAFNIDEIEALGFHGLAREYFRSDVRIEYTTDSDWVFTSISAYNVSENQNGFDNSLVPTDEPLLTINGSKVKDFSQELRVTSPQDKRLRGFAGFYYYREKDGEGFNVETDMDEPEFGSIFRFDSGDGVRNWAFFVHGEFDITERLTLTAEGRYQEDKIIATDDDDGETTEVTPFTNERTATFSSFLPRFSLKFQVNENFNVYGSVARGNKPGGFNDLPSDAMEADLEFFRMRGFETFDEEKVWSYEIGAKGVSDDGRFNASGALFYLDWTSQQLTQSEPYERTNGTFTTVPFLVNAGASEIKGLELEVAGRPVDWFDFRVTYAYVDGEFTDFYDTNTEEILDTDGEPSFLDTEQQVPNPADVDGPNGQVAGNKLAQTPTHQFTISNTLRFPLGNIGNWANADSGDVNWFLRSDMSIESKRFVQVHNLAHTGDSYNWNLRTGIETDSWTLTFFVNNVLEDRTPLVVTRLVDFNRPLLIPDPVRSFIFLPNARFTFFRDFTIGVPRQRQFGATLNLKF